MKGIKIDWTSEMDAKLREEFPKRITQDISKELGVSLRSAIRRARLLGIEKEEGFLETHREEITQRATKSLQRKARTSGSWGFQKGQRAYPEGEFKPGHSEDPETKTRRIEKARKTRNETIYDERIRLKYGLRQRTKLKLNTMYYFKKLV